MQQVRRAYLTTPGEMLYFPRVASDLHERLIRFLSDSGVPGENILVNSLIAVPLPRKDPAAGPRGWFPGINPMMLWHPLFWLSDRTAYPNSFTDEDGTVYTEDDDHWAARVAVELMDSGLYNTEDGSWVDVLAAYGLDITAPDVQQRAAAWLTGAADPVLDTISLSPALDNPDDPHWASEHIDAMLVAAKPASWGIMAASILESLNVSLPASADQDQARHVIGIVADMGAQLVGDAPNDADVDLAELFIAIGDAAFNPQIPFETVYGQVQTIVNALAATRDAFYPVYEEYVEAVAAELAAE